MSFDLVLFGGTGDLTWRKLMPALFQAFRHGTLPAGGRIMGVGRDDLTHAQYRALIRSRFENVELAKRPSEEEFTRFADLLEYVRMDLSRPDDYALLATALGLVAAIPAVVIYNVFARSITGYKARVADASAEVLLLVSRDLDHLPPERSSQPHMVKVG